jgi:MFS family permease
MFIGSMFLFSIFCLGAGFSQDGMTLDILCGVLGIWSASAVPPAQGILGTIYSKPAPRKNRVFGVFSAGNPLGYVFGIILSGLFTQIFNWRAGFFLLAIVYFCISVVAMFTVPKDTTIKQSLNDETIKRLDLPGTAMTIFGTGMFCAALRYVFMLMTVRLLILYSLASDAPNGWKTPYVLVLLILGIFLIAVFIVWENKYPYAMIPMSVFKDRDFSLVRVACS